MLFFENLNRDFGTLGIGILQIGLRIRNRRPQIRLYANFHKFGCIISPKNNQLACFFLSPCIYADNRLKLAKNQPSVYNVISKVVLILKTAGRKLQIM